MVERLNLFLNLLNLKKLIGNKMKKNIKISLTEFIVYTFLIYALGGVGMCLQILINGGEL